MPPSEFASRFGPAATCPPAETQMTSTRATESKASKLTRLKGMNLRRWDTRPSGINDLTIHIPFSVNSIVGNKLSLTCLALWLIEVDLDVVEVVLGVFEDEGAVLVVEVAAEFGGDAGPEGFGRNDGVLGNDGACGDEGAGADAGVVEDGGAHADDHLVFNNAAVDGGIVADGDPVADVDGVEIA